MRWKYQVEEKNKEFRGGEMTHKVIYGRVNDWDYGRTHVYNLKDERGQLCLSGDALKDFGGKNVQVTITEREEPPEPIMEMVAELVGV